MKKILAIGMAAAMLAGAGTAMAANTDVIVSANIKSTCVITGTDNLDFGDIDPSMAANISVPGQVSFWCTNGANYGLTINTVSQPINTSISRTMNDGGSNTLAYTFTTLSAPTGTGTGKTGAATSYKYSATLTPANVENAVAANYSDTITIDIAP